MNLLLARTLILVAALISLAGCKRGISKEEAVRTVRALALAENKQLFGAATDQPKVTVKNGFYRVQFGHTGFTVELPRFRCAVRIADGKVPWCEALQPFGGKHCIKRHLLGSEDSGKWRSVNCEGGFSFKLPPELRQELAAGIDSSVALYSSPTMQVSFDYGPYSSRLDSYADEPGYEEAHRKIGGVEAKTVYCRTTHEKYHHFSGVAFNQQDISEASGASLSLVVAYKEAAQRADADRVIESIRFPAKKAPAD